MSKEQAAQGTHCRLDVAGMDCAECSDEIRRALRKIEGVQDVHVDVVGGKVDVAYAESRLARADLVGAVERIGYKVRNRELRGTAFRIEGMDCADEMRILETKLSKLPGVNRLRFDLLARRLVVEGEIKAPEIMRAVKETGMRASLESDEARREGLWKRRGRLVMTCMSGACLLIGGVLIARKAAEPLITMALAYAVVTGGWFIIPRGLRALRGGALDMNFLMTVAAVGAAFINEWGEAASAMFLFSVAQLVETYSIDRARNAIRALMDLGPAEAVVLRGGREQRVPISDAAVGETVLVRPGQKIPLDGTVLRGDSAVNQAPITGESIPVEKHPGTEVFAGSINVQGLLEIRVTKRAEDTTLARIIHAVEEAQASRAPSQSFVDRFSRIYTPAVVALAALIIVLLPLLFHGNWSSWLYRGLTLLVIACPCALVISTPVTIVSGLAGAARRGILIKGGVHLENAGKLTVVAFDKTGTLTQGTPEVVEVISLDGTDSEQILSLAAGIEYGSEHPLGAAIARAAQGRGLKIPEASDFESLIARGIKAKVNGSEFYVGNTRLMDELGIWSPDHVQRLADLQRKGMTPVIVASRERVLGLIALADQIRANAKAAIQSIRKADVRQIVMLTGDNRFTAASVAADLQLNDYRAELLPQEKVEFVKAEESKGNRVAFVGDGINDAPALASATIGMAMGTAGTDIALETADIALMADDLSKVAEAIQTSKKTVTILKQNIVFSIGIKAVFLVLAVLGMATLWMAVAADMGASLAVVANGLRALRRS